MNRYSFAVVALALTLTSTIPLEDASAGNLLSPAAAERVGLVEAWHRQLGTVGGERSIIDLQVWVQGNTENEFLEIVRADKDGKPIEGGEVLRRILIGTMNSSGQEIEMAEAERLAKLDVLKLERRGVSATYRAIKLKQVRLYMLGDDGGLSAYDGETGELLWNVRLGDPKYGYGTLGIADGYVTVINGTTMYRVIADVRKKDNQVLPAGRPLPPVRLDRIPVVGATNTNSYSVVPNTRSGLDCYTYEDEPREPNFQMFSGQALGKPVRFPTSSKVAWTTDRGFLYVMETEGTPSTQFRLKTDGLASGGVGAASDDRFFLGSSGGRVYGVRATRSGQVFWNRSFGEPFYSTPFISGEHVLVASSYGNLYCLSAADGTQQWAAPSPNIDTIFASVGNFYFGRTTSGLLTVLARDSGQSAAIGGSVFVDRIVMNPETDRVYLVSDGGTVQCLRPGASELPVFARDVTSPAPAETKEEVKKPTSNDASNPFGAKEEAAAPGTDPFGGGADPFGGGGEAGADAPMEDPFGAPAGGGIDPFGN